MFGKTSDPKTTEDTTVQNTVVPMPEKKAPEAEQSRTAARPAPGPASLSDAVTSTSQSAKKSLISEGFEFTGDMKSEGSLTVDGSIKGNLIVKSLVIGATGMVDGSVKADNISVEGGLYGAVNCQDLIVGARAVVDGQLAYETITIQRGGTIKGDLKRGSRKAA